MNFKILSSVINPLKLTFRGLEISITGTNIQKAYSNVYPPRPFRRLPEYYQKQERSKYKENLTPENDKFIKRMVEFKYGPEANIAGVNTYNHTPLKQEPLLRGTWTPSTRRSGLIAKKLGFINQWTKKGEKKTLTLLQIIDNHVVKYIPPGEYTPPRKCVRRYRYKGNNMGCLVVGAVNCDPQNFTKEYCGLFSKAGVMPKKILTRFPISSEAAIQPGTPLLAAHFQTGDYVDVTGFTIDRGFQGVMKRWCFHGMPRSHGVTKSHRRPGNIGGGGEKARVWPGKKMPGHMGNRLRAAKGLKVWRINHEFNVLYVSGPAIPGKINSYCHIFDTKVYPKRRKSCPNFPTYYPEDHKEPLPAEEFHPDLYNFNDPTIVFEEAAPKKSR